MPLTIGIRNSSFIEKDLESSNWNLESTAWNPEFETFLDSLTLRHVAKINMVAETQQATRFP